MEKTILSANQKVLLVLLSQQKTIKNFYLSGGTALAEYYLHHRYSEDFDFFSEEEFDVTAIQAMFKKIKRHLPIEKIDYRQSFNRNLFFLHIQKDIIKIEFTYYPFPQINQPRIIDNIAIDSLLDIAVNKTATICQNPRSRDFIDLYLIINKGTWEFPELIKKARNKFDTYYDPLHIAKQLLTVLELKDYPRMIGKLAPKKWQDFWLNEAEKLQSKALT